MNIIEFIESIIDKKTSLPEDLSISICDKKYSFYEGINIIDCNQLNDYEINDENNINLDISKRKQAMFGLFHALEKLVKTRTLKYKYYLSDTTKTLFYILLKLDEKSLKASYDKITQLQLPPNSQFVVACINHVKYWHFYNKYFLDEDYTYSQKLVKFSISKGIEKKNNYILIKLCHDTILIDKDQITFEHKESYDIVLKIISCLDNTGLKPLINFTPTTASFLYPIAIDFQLFDLMLYEYELFPFIFANEHNSLIEDQEKVIYTLKIYDVSLKVSIYNKWKQYTEVIKLNDLDWYLYSSVKIILDYLYLLYINFHKSYELEYQGISPAVPLKINHNRLFGKYYTRYFNNQDKVLPVLADENYCIENNLAYVQWNGNFYMAPENSGYVIVLNQNYKFSSNAAESAGIPKCVKVIRKYKNKDSGVYSNISYELGKTDKGLIHPALFLLYGFELPNLFRCYLDISDKSIEFELCPKCKTYVKIPSQENIIKVVKDKFVSHILSAPNPENNINVLCFSVDSNSNVFPYGVTDYAYNFDSSLPFVIIMLNTTKTFTTPNYRYEYLASPDSKLFHIKDKCVKAIFSMYRTYGIAIVDTKAYKSNIIQYVIDKNITILVAEKTNANYYLWHSTYSQALPEIPIISSDDLLETLPSFSDLCSLVEEITDYHYFEKNTKEIFVYGVWSENIYYPCKAAIQSSVPDISNKPFLLLERDIDGYIYKTSPSSSDYVIFDNSMT